ncbi:response regulator transcription factor [Roseomonas hellenica]|nr:response regulator transcription factor [Plastoroseomonas hellenica]
MILESIFNTFLSIFPLAISLNLYNSPECCGAKPLRILLVEDDPFDALEMSHMLRHVSATVDIAGTGAAACELAGLHDYDLVLLDLAPPDMEGHEVLRRLRAAGTQVPVMMLPGHSLPAEKIRALGFGADATGIQAVARPAAPIPEPSLTAGQLTLDPTGRVATVRGRLLRLTGKEYDVLELLVRRKDTVLTKAAFLDHLYGGADGPEAKIIDVFICKLRRKLGQTGAGDLIGTVWGQGYTLRDPAPPPAARCPAGGRPALVA